MDGGRHILGGSVCEMKENRPEKNIEAAVSP